MGQFILKRLLWIVPTILLILVGTFLLDQASPDDRIARELILEGSDIAVSREDYLSAYVQLASDRGKLLPTFYFSVLPDYMPRQIHEVFPLAKRKAVESMIRDTRQGELVLTLFDNVSSLIEIADSQKNSLLLRQLLALEQSRTAAQFDDRINDLSLSFGDMPEVSLIINDAGRLKSSKGVSHPIIYWNGSKCAFHKWLANGLSPSGRISLTDGRPVWDKIWSAMSWTITMSLTSLILIGILSLGLAYLMARYQNTKWDQVTNAFLYALYAMPLFWFCTLMVVFFTTSDYGSWTNIFPSVGIKATFGATTFWQRLEQNAGQLILPILCIVVHAMAYITRQTRGDIISQFDQPYMLSAQARGIDSSALVCWHALPNALLSYTTLMTGAIPRLFTGSVVVEVIFNIPGVGKLLLESIRNADWPVTFHILVVVGIFTVLGYLIGDIILARLFPKTMKTMLLS